MHQICQEDLSLFKTVTCENDNTASIYLHRYPDVNTAIANYFSAKEADATLASTNSNLLPGLLSSRNQNSQIDHNNASQNIISIFSRSKSLEGKKSAQENAASNMEIERKQVQKNEGYDDISESSEEEEDSYCEDEDNDNADRSDSELYDVEYENFPNERSNKSKVSQNMGNNNQRAPIIDDNIAQFVAITNCDQRTAKDYLDTYRNLETAIDHFFMKQNKEESSMNIHSATSRPPNDPIDMRTNPFSFQKNPNYKKGKSKECRPFIERSMSQMESQIIHPPQIAKADSMNSIPKANLFQSSQTQKNCRLRGKYENYVKKYTKGLKDENKQWPKFLGSLVVNCEISNENIKAKMQLNDELKFEADSIEFASANIIRKKKKGGLMIRETVGKNWSIKGQCLQVNCIWKNQKVGVLNCYFEEIFVFLLDRKYVFLEGTVIELEGMGFSTYNNVKVQLDVFLTEEVVKSPLNVISIPGRKRGGKDKSGQDESTQKTHQMLKLAKESFVKLFNMLKIKVSIPAIVKLRQRIDPFQRIIREKYQRGKRNIFSRGSPAVLVTDDFPEYYKENQQEGLDRTQPSQRSLRSNTRLFGIGMDRMNSHSIPMNNPMESSSEDSAIEFDEEEEVFDRISNSNIHNRFINSNLGSLKKNSINTIKENETEEKNDANKANDDLFNSENQLASYYAAAEAPSTLKSELHVYQKQALSWMKYREGIIDKNELFDKTYEEQRILNDLFQEMTLLDGSKLYFNPFNGEMSLDFPTIKACKGGILADEMGLGKTVMTIALLHSHKRNLLNNNDIRRIEEDNLNDEKSEEEVAPKTVKKGKKKTKDNEDSDFEMDFENVPTITKKTARRTLTSFLESTGDLSLSEDSDFDYEEIVGKKTKKKVKTEKSEKSVKKSKNKAKESFDVNLPTALKKKNATKAKKTPKKTGKKEKRLAGTLIVVPLTVLNQWKNEIEKHSVEGSMKVCLYYENRKKDIIHTYDVVLTTYGILEAEYGKENSSELFECEWFRVILDEAHYIKSRQIKTTRAACELTSEYRWCLTGTPLQNKLDDMFSLLQFLRMDTWGEYFWWNTYINKYVSHDEASNLIRGILKPVILRRTKKSTYLDGRNILELPGKEIHNVFVKLTPEERSVYNCFFGKSRAQFNEMIDGGTLGYEYTHIFELLIRLRQVCDHAALVFSKDDLKDKGSLENAVFKFLEGKVQGKTENKKEKTMEIEDEQTDKGKNSKMHSEFIQMTIERLKNQELEPCCICLEEITVPAIANCGHIFCKGCLEMVLLNTKKCALCQQEISARDVMTVSLEDKEKCKELLNIDGESFKKSSKLEAVMKTTKEIAQKKEKVVIFSQFIGMLNLIERFIIEEGIGYRRIDGASTMQSRARKIEEFNTGEDITVFLISLKSGAIGLNLTVASNVFLVDPWWNPAVEDQAIERVHRIGQEKKVNVYRFVCEKTIEERIMQLNAQKKVMINNILQFNPQEQKKQNMENMMYMMRGFEDDS